MKVPCKNIPTYNAQTGEWTKTSFSSQKEMGDFLKENCFKEPGEYGFDESTKKWNEVANYYEKNGYYTIFAEGTTEYKNFWDTEKLKCRLGVLWVSGDKTFYLTRDYYFLLNYCRIINKEANQTEGFASIRDVQYHMCLYMKIAEIFSKHAAILKRRQMMFSYTMVAKCLNYLMFESKKTIKIFASDDGYINDKKGSWKILNGYVDFLNRKTAWFRNYQGTYPETQQIEKVKIQGKWFTEGNESTLLAFTTKKDEKAGVGGPLYLGWYEEGGIAPTMDTTLQYLEPAIENGNEKSGSMVMGGSVGDLDECKPLQAMVEFPKKYDVLATPTKWYDESGIPRDCSLFIPAQYGMPQAVDEWGNSLVDLALTLLDEQEEQWKQLPPDKYVLRKSQNPRTIKDAFRIRKISEYPVLLLQNQQDRIKIKDKEKKWDFTPIKCLLEEDKDGSIIMNTKDLPREHEYPINPEWEDKRGCCTIYEMPLEKNPAFFTYFGGLDPVEADDTSTSNSVASLDIFRKGQRIKYKDKDGKEHVRIEGDKLVATYRGRFNSVEKTNEQMWYLIQMYNAFTLVERSKPNFINYMRRLGREKYLAKESDIPLFKDINVNAAFTQSPFGFIFSAKGENAMWKFFKDTLKSYLKTEYSYSYLTTGEVMKIFRGVDRIDDFWLIEEIIQFVEGAGNYDRKISFMAALTLCKINEINVGMATTYEKTQEEKEKIPVHQPKPRQSLLGGYNKPTRIHRPGNKTRSLI